MAAGSSVSVVVVAPKFPVPVALVYCSDSPSRDWALEPTVEDLDVVERVWGSAVPAPSVHPAQREIGRCGAGRDGDDQRRRHRREQGEQGDDGNGWAQGFVSGT